MEERPRQCRPDTGAIAHLAKKGRNVFLTIHLTASSNNQHIKASAVRSSSENKSQN